LGAGNTAEKASVNGSDRFFAAGNGSPISVSGQMQKWISVSQPFFS
jgi:hypothetical protein